MRFVIAPIGTVSDKIVEWVEDGIANRFPDAEIYVSARVPLRELKLAFNEERRQYMGPWILHDLASIFEETRGPDSLVVGVMDQDAYAPGLTFVFGQTKIAERTLFVTSARLMTSPSRARARIVRTTIHEIGHAFGLPHCETQRCLMRMSSSPYDSDTRGNEFCADCVRRIRR